MPHVIILCGSEKDFPFAEKIKAPLEEKGVSVKLFASSAHKNGEKVLEIVREFDDGKNVFVTIAGRSNALSGFVAGHTNSVVIACPPHKDKMDFFININSTLQMPSKTPVLTILDPGNCVLAVERILNSQK